MRNRIPDLHASTAPRSSAGASRDGGGTQWPRFRLPWLLTGLLGYLGIMAFVQSFLFEAVSFDASEQVLWTQTLRRGYGIQPPLYTWLQWAVFSVFGINATAIALTKEILLGITAITTYLIAKRITLDPRIAGLALISFLFIPQFSYESHRDLTHSILACALAALELYLALKLIEERRLLYTYVLFGLVAGLGLLAKYSYGLFLLSLCLGMLSLPAARPAIFDRRFWLAVLIAITLFAPHGLWLWTTFDPELQAQMAHKLQTPGETQALADIGRGLFTLVKVMAGFFALLIPVYGGAFFFRNPRSSRPAQTQSSHEILLARLLLIQVLLLLGLVLAFQVSSFKQRWMQPLLFAVPIYLLLQLRPWINALSCRRLVALGTVIGMCTLAILPLRVLLPDAFEGHKRFNTPFDALAEDLRHHGFTRGVIATEDHWMGGNLRVKFPRSAIITPNFAPTRTSEPIALAVWQGKAMPPALAALLSKAGAQDLLAQQARLIRLRYHYSQQVSATFSYLYRRL
ncbi:MAG: glycosyltransferase family 39 protein [Gammaproteobacteria bacterium]